MSAYRLGGVMVSWLPDAEREADDNVKSLTDALYRRGTMHERLTNAFGNIYRMAISGGEHRGARAILQRVGNDHMVIVATWSKQQYGIGKKETDERTYSGYLNLLRDLHVAEISNE
ncbi:hypothetical protein pkur_cds_303 [Pandoravirus kuranda]|uniref:Uncharacterized protein n=1 Tax=Pandoravirus kuranda TaxID=3019033 RepID=A0AA95EGI6_9VIRU|nr:hypothetical protein pkur_cds_303 [Pandoravirus kuranda]